MSIDTDNPTTTRKTTTVTAEVPPAPGRSAQRRPARQPATRQAGQPTVKTGLFHLGKRTRKVVLTAHVLSSVGWFGVALTIAFSGIVAANTGDASLPPALWETMRTAVWLSVPIGLVSAASGIVLSLGTKWGLTRYWWVMIKEVITLAVIVTDPLVVIPTIKNVIDGGEPTEVYGPLIAHCVMLTVATVLSMFKPFGRRRAITRQSVAAS